MRAGGILEDDRRQLLHLETLRIVAADLVDVADHVIEVEFTEVNDQRFLGHGWLPGTFGVPNNRRMLIIGATANACCIGPGKPASDQVFTWCRLDLRALLLDGRLP